MVQKWCVDYGAFLALNVGLMLLVMILMVSKSVNLLSIYLLILAHLVLTYLSLKARCKLWRCHRLMGLARIDIMLDYTKTLWIGLLFPLILSGLVQTVFAFDDIVLTVLTLTVLCSYFGASTLTYIVLRRI